MRSPTKTETKENIVKLHRGRPAICPRSPFVSDRLGLLISSQNHLVLEDTQQALPHLTRLLAGVNAAPDTSLLVVVADGGGLGVVGSQTLGQGVGVVVGALDEGLAGDVVGHVALGRVEDLVVRTAGSGVDQTASDTGDEEGVVDLKLNGVLELLLTGRKHLIQALGLGDSPRETVQDETVNSC